MFPFVNLLPTLKLLSQFLLQATWCVKKKKKLSTGAKKRRGKYVSLKLVNGLLIAYKCIKYIEIKLPSNPWAIFGPIFQNVLRGGKLNL